MDDNSRAVLDYIAFIVRQKLDSIPTQVLIEPDHLELDSHESHSDVFGSQINQRMEVLPEQVLIDVSSAVDNVFVRSTEVSIEGPPIFLTELIDRSAELSIVDTSQASGVLDDGLRDISKPYPSISFIVDSPQVLGEVENDIVQIKSSARNKYVLQHHQGSANRFIFKAIAVSALLHVGVFLSMSDAETDKKTSPAAVVQSQNICSESSSNTIQTHISRIGINVDQMSPCDIKTELNSIKLLAKKMAVKRVSVSKPCLSIWMEAQKKSKQCMNRAEII